MSKYLSFKDITFPDRESLLKALADCGYTTVEEGQELTLYGYQNDARPETAQIVVRRQHIGSASNDLGFQLTDSGYIPLISEYDRSYMHQGKFLPTLRTKYYEHAIARVAQNNHATLTRRTEGSKVKIVIRP